MEENIFVILPSAHITANEFSAVSPNKTGGPVRDGFIHCSTFCVAYKATDNIAPVIVYVTHTDLLNGKV
jgi:hypothetical protein